MPQVIDIMLFKGQAEVHEVLAHYMQRHHLARAARLHRSPVWGFACVGFVLTVAHSGPVALAACSCCKRSAITPRACEPQISNYVSVVRGDTATHTAVATRASPFLSKFLKSNNTD